VVARLEKFNERYKTALFLSIIGEDAMEIFDGMHFAEGKDRNKLDMVIAKFEAFCIGETNKTHECFIFNSHDQKDGESIEQYATALCTLCQMYNFCSCLQYSLLRDRIFIGIRDDSVRERPLLERKLTLAQALDICQSNESTSIQLKKMSDAIQKRGNQVFTEARRTKRSQRESSPRGELHQSKAL